MSRVAALGLALLLATGAGVEALRHGGTESVEPGPAAMQQSPTLSKEYIHAGGRLLAIEEQGDGEPPPPPPPPPPNGTDTIGVHRPSNNTFFLRNTNTSGFADLVAVLESPGHHPVVGDWNGDGIDTIGAFL